MLAPYVAGIGEMVIKVVIQIPNNATVSVI